MAILQDQICKDSQCFHRVPAWGLVFIPVWLWARYFPFPSYISQLYYYVGVWQYNLEELSMILRLFLSNLLASLDVRQGLGVDTNQTLVPMGLGWDRELKCQYTKWCLIRGVETTADNWVQIYCISISSKQAIWARVQDLVGLRHKGGGHQGTRATRMPMLQGALIISRSNLHWGADFIRELGWSKFCIFYISC